MLTPWLETSQLKNSAIIVGVDFNLPGWDWRTRTIKQSTKYPSLHYLFGNLLDDTGLTQIVDIPTRKDNTLDLIITNLPSQAQRGEVIPGLSDHDIVFTEFVLAPINLKQKPRAIPLYKKANWDTMKQELSYLQKYIIDNQNTLNVEDMWDKFKTTITALVKDHIPHKQQKVKIVNHGSTMTSEN